MKRQLFTLFFISGLLIMFSYTLVNKVRNPEFLAYSIGNYPLYKYLLSEAVTAEMVAYFIMFIEFCLILSFFLLQLRYSMIFSSAVLVFYVMNLVSLVIENEFFDCGCGLFYISLNPKYMIFFDLLIISVLFHLLKSSTSEKTYFLTGIAKLYGKKIVSG